MENRRRLFGRLMAFWLGGEPMESEGTGIGFRRRMRKWMLGWLQEENGFSKQGERSWQVQGAAFRNPEAEERNGREKNFWETHLSKEERNKKSFWQREADYFTANRKAVSEQRAERKAADWISAAAEEAPLVKRLRLQEENKEDTLQEGERQEKEKSPVLLKAIQAREEIFESGNVKKDTLLWQKEPMLRVENRQVIPMQKKRTAGYWGKETRYSMKEQEFSAVRQTKILAGEEKREPTVDIDKLMKQFAQRLWEEREGCSRRKYR